MPSSPTWKVRTNKRTHTNGNTKWITLNTGKQLLASTKQCPNCSIPSNPQPMNWEVRRTSSMGIAGDAQLLHVGKALASGMGPSSRTPGSHCRNGSFWYTGGSESTALLKQWRRQTSPNTLLWMSTSGSGRCAPQNWCPSAFSLVDPATSFKLMRVFFDISQGYDKKQYHVLYKSLNWLSPKSQQNHRGHATSREVWVFGLVHCGQSPALGYMEAVQNRTAATLLPIIQARVRPGTTVHSDEWSAYRQLQGLPNVQQHQTVNHSLHFVDPTTGVHTQNVESYWARVKLKFKRMKRVDAQHLPSYVHTRVYVERTVRDNSTRSFH